MVMILSLFNEKNCVASNLVIIGWPNGFAIFLSMILEWRTKTGLNGQSGSLDHTDG